MATIVKKYERPAFSGERNDGPRVVETAGYRSARVQVEELLAAGKRLDQFRKEQYDFAPGQKEDMEFEDPTRSRNFDMADATAIEREVKRRLAEQQKGRESREDSTDVKSTSDKQTDVEQENPEDVE